jgi:hypothetical protein
VSIGPPSDIVAAPLPFDAMWRRRPHVNISV